MWLFTTISVGPTTAYVPHAAIICTPAAAGPARTCGGARQGAWHRLQRSVVVARHLLVVPSHGDGAKWRGRCAWVSTGEPPQCPEPCRAWRRSSATVGRRARAEGSSIREFRVRAGSATRRRRRRAATPMATPRATITAPSAPLPCKAMSATPSYPSEVGCAPTPPSSADHRPRRRHVCRSSGASSRLPEDYAYVKITTVDATSRAAPLRPRRAAYRAAGREGSTSAIASYDAVANGKRRQAAGSSSCSDAYDAGAPVPADRHGNPAHRRRSHGELPSYQLALP